MKNQGTITLIGSRVGFLFVSIFPGLLGHAFEVQRDVAAIAITVARILIGTTLKFIINQASLINCCLD